MNPHVTGLLDSRDSLVLYAGHSRTPIHFSLALSQGLFRSLKWNVKPSLSRTQSTTRHQKQSEIIVIAGYTVTNPSPDTLHPTLTHCGLSLVMQSSLLEEIPCRQLHVINYCFPAYVHKCGARPPLGIPPVIPAYLRTALIRPWYSPNELGRLRFVDKRLHIGP